MQTEANVGEGPIRGAAAELLRDSLHSLAS